MYGQSVTFTATVTNTNTGVAPRGSVEFYDGSTDLGAGTFGTSSSNASTWTFATSRLAASTHSIYAVYTDTTDADFHGSDDKNSVLSQTVTPAPLTDARSGTYILILHTDRPTIRRIGRLETFWLPAGYYLSDPVRSHPLQSLEW